MTINVGDRVRDKVTGFMGIAVCRSEWLYGCVRIAVQPEETKEGREVPDAYHFDEPQLEVVDVRAVVPWSEAKTGADSRARVATGGPAREGDGFTRPDAR